MRFEFQAPARQTSVRTLASTAALRGAINKLKPFVLVDEAVPLGFTPRGMSVLRVKGGEGCKRWSELERVLEWLDAAGAERSQYLVVIGGGSLLDLGALAAALYRRGMPLVLVPTTLLGMVDATLGGKNAVDRENGGRLRKNFAGTFYFAEQIWLHPHFLATLPAAERRSGAGEVYKTLWLAGGRRPLSALDAYVASGGAPGSALLKLVERCLKVKSAFVTRDPLDTGRVREALNFGHTAGHALESASGLPHGECVLWGMAVESFLLGSRPMAREVLGAAGRLGLELPEIFHEKVEWERLLSADKKARAGKIEMSLLSEPGKIVRRKFTAARVAAALRGFPGSCRREAERLRS